MTNCRRNFVPGGCQFFTVNLAECKSRVEMTGFTRAQPILRADLTDQ
jgi:hypothetical protein